MQLEYKVIRLQLQALDVNVSYLLEEMSPDEAVPHLVQQRVLTEKEAAEVLKKSTQLEKVLEVVKVLHYPKDLVVGRFLTFCMALTNAGQFHVSETLCKSELYYVTIIQW